MKILVLGATGGVGRHLVKEGLAWGHDVTAFARHPENLSEHHASLRKVKGDVLKFDDLKEAVREQQAVIYSVGVRTTKPTTLFSESTRLLIEAMRLNGVKKLICITGVGAGETKGHGGFLYDRLIYPLFTRNLYVDKERQESLIVQSDLEWIIIRPAPFSEKEARSRLLVQAGRIDQDLTKISRRETALFILDQVTSDRYSMQKLFIGHP